MMANIVYTTQSYTNAVPVRSFCDLLDMTENFINEFTSIRIGYFLSYQRGRLKIVTQIFKETT